MADRYLLESGAPDGYQLEDGSGVLLLDGSPWVRTVISLSPDYWWRLGESAGTIAVEQIHATNGTYQNTPTLGVAGLVTLDTDTAVTLDGTTPEYISATPHMATAGTAVFWLKRARSGLDEVIIGGPAGAVLVRLNADNKLWLAKEDTAFIVSSTTTITDTSLHMGAVVWDGAGSGVVYIDGTDVTGIFGSASPTSGDTLNIGAKYNGTTGFGGTLDEVALWNRILSAGEVTALWNAGTATAATTYNRTASDTVTLTESVARVSTALRTTSDTVTLTDAAARVSTALRTAADSVGLSDAVARVVTNLRTAADTVTAGNTVARVVSLFRTASDTVSLSDSVARIVSNLRTAADSVTLGNTVAGIKIIVRTATDSVTLTNTVARLVGLARTVSDSVTAGNTVARVVSLFRRAGTGAFDPDVFDPDVFDTWGDRVILSMLVTGIRTGTVIRTLADSVGLSDAVTRTGTFLRTVADTVTAANTVERLVSLFRTAADSVTLGNVVAGIKVVPRSLADSITASDSLARIVTNLRAATDSVTVSEAVTRAVSRTRTLADSVTLGNTVSAFRLVARNLSDTLNIGNAVTRIGAFLRTLADALGLTDAVSQNTINQVERGFVTCSNARVGNATASDRLVLGGASTSDSGIGGATPSDTERVLVTAGDRGIGSVVGDDS